MLEGKSVLVTGAARGVGAVIAQRMAAQGATVALTDVLEERGEATAAKIGGSSFFTPLDVTDEEAWGRAVEQLLERTGKIDVLVNNAAVLHMGTVEHTPASVFRRLLEVNTTGPYLGVRAVVPAMKAAGGGSIVNISSVDALLQLNGLTAYIASKSGLRGLSKSLALELGRSGIRVNCVCPSGGGDEMAAPWRSKIASVAGTEMKGYVGQRGIPRAADVDEIADAALFLASDMARFITGVDLPVDGGHTAGTYLEAFNL